MKKRRHSLLFLFAIFLDDRLHLRKLRFHILSQLELGTATAQVLLRVADAEIIIPVEVIRQKTDAAFQCHQPRTPGAR